MREINQLLRLNIPHTSTLSRMERELLRYPAKGERTNGPKFEVQKVYNAPRIQSKPEYSLTPYKIPINCIDAHRASMKILFVHQNFPGQYLHLAQHLGSIPGNQVVFITQRRDAELPGVRKLVYQPHRLVTRNMHHYLQGTEAGLLNAQTVARIALNLKQSGFTPDVIVGHHGWGEIWYLKDVFPDVPLLGYFEFFYRAQGADVGFAPDEPQLFDTGPKAAHPKPGESISTRCGGHRPMSYRLAEVSLP